MTKGRAFLLCMIFVMLIFTAMFAFGAATHDAAIIPVSLCVGSLVTITGGYIGLQITDSAVKGKNWNQEMFDSLHQTGETEGGKP